ncbi:MAG: Maf family nucleotide pyrophosphatase [Hyphomicrobiaceae bacterium]
MSEPGQRKLVLASGSSSRRRLLEAAGLTFRVVPPDVDETALKGTLLAQTPKPSAATVAETLARAKCEAVSGRIAGAVVIGADQVLALDEELFDKPPDVAAARAQLLRLRGTTHHLLTAVALAQEGRTVWQCMETATLTLRNFSPMALDRYLAVAGDRVTRSVGAYEIEGPAIQLFERIEGDYFTILGLPLLPLLAELRARGAIDV